MLCIGNILLATIVWSNEISGWHTTMQEYSYRYLPLCKLKFSDRFEPNCPY